MELHRIYREERQPPTSADTKSGTDLELCIVPHARAHGAYSGDAPLHLGCQPPIGPHTHLVLLFGTWICYFWHFLCLKAYFLEVLLLPVPLS